MRVECNKYHSGNRRLVWDRNTDTYECQGCMTYHTGPDVRDARRGPVTVYDMTGGVHRVN